MTLDFKYLPFLWFFLDRNREDKTLMKSTMTYEEHLK